MHPALRKILVGALAAAVLTATAATAALAQTPEPKPTEKPRAERANELLDGLASRLGKSPEELRAAIVAAQKDLVAKALAAGRLTQEQANRLTQRIEQRAAEGLGLGALRAPKIAARVAPKIAATRELAHFLNLEPRELAQELRAGKSLAEVAQAKGKSRDDVKAFLTNQAKTRFDKLVADGRLTREQADARLKALTERLDRAIDQKVPARRGRAAPGAAAPSRP
ncbi:MAG TPA: DUF2680 domain-containing protein [Chloroflexota bacterium]|nr:DUF2680 domain-containing protein [Chloroflexota bacterium]